MQATSCPNFNHRRANAPVRFCPTCGDVVNEAVPTQKCSEEKHAKKRRGRREHCIDCGEQLIAG
jgi:rRNA maturation protein Nop10